MRNMCLTTNPILDRALPSWRARLTLFLFFSLSIILASRALFVQILSTKFLQKQGERRYERNIILPANRGKILDRNGVIFASSTPAYAIWADPGNVKRAIPSRVNELATLLDMPISQLHDLLSKKDKRFVFLKRQVDASVANKIGKMAIPGVHQQFETQRHYPQGKSAAHVVGFTNFEGEGQEGIERAFNAQFLGVPGNRRVIKDRLGHVIEDVQLVNLPIDGHNVNLSIDTRIQHLVFKELQEAMGKHQAQGAAAIVLDVHTGEVLALVNLHTFDPNDRKSLHGMKMRNQVIADTFEPGSIIKPFIVGLALDLNRINTSTLFKTGNGNLNYYGNIISDVSHNGTINVTDILRRSSNIGMTLISEQLAAHEIWHCFSALGIGKPPLTDFPGTSQGYIRFWDQWQRVEKAAITYGYGVSLSLIQVARAYTVFARNGDMISLTLVRRNSTPDSTTIYQPKTANLMRTMLEITSGPTGARYAQIQGYRAAGKSGTTRKLIDGKYSREHYRSSFVGFVPVSQPKIIIAVTVDNPVREGYYGAAVAAPVFSRIANSSLHLTSIKPDINFRSVISEDLIESYL